MLQWERKATAPQNLLLENPRTSGLRAPRATSLHGEGNSPPRRRDVPCSSTRSSGEVSPLQLCLVGCPCVASPLRGLTVLERAPRCCSTPIAFPKNPQIPGNPGSETGGVQEASGGRAAGGSFWDAIEGHHPPAGLPSGFPAFLHRPCGVRSNFQV